MGIEDILMYDETIFRNSMVFNPDYTPQDFDFRDNQMEAMAMSIRPALHEGRPVNSIIMGPCATGKTTAVKKVFELVGQTSNKIVCCFINCQLHTTPFSIMSQIFKKIFNHYPPETGVPYSKIYQQVMNHLVKEDKSLIVAFDDVNYLFQSNNANKLFYDILRAYEEFPGVRTGLFVILSDLEFKYALDKNVNTVFIPQDIVFQPYSRSEILEILTKRAKHGFFDDVISDDILEDITDYTLDSGDLRVGIDLLKVCGNIAESNASPKITPDFLEQAKNQQVSVNLVETFKSLSDVERHLLKIVAENKKILTAGELSKIFKNNTGLSYATFNRTLDKLEFLRLIDTKLTGKGVRGNSRQVIIRFNPEDIKSLDI